MNVRKCLRATAALTAGLVAAQSVKQEFSKSRDWKAISTGVKIKIPEISLPSVFAQVPLAKDPTFSAAENHLRTLTNIEFPLPAQETPYRHFSLAYDSNLRCPLVTYEYLTPASLAAQGTGMGANWLNDPRIQGLYPLNLIPPYTYKKMVPEHNIPALAWATQYFSNFCPMNPVIYTQWCAIENEIRSMVSSGGIQGAHVFTGPICVAVQGVHTYPIAFYKVVIEHRYPLPNQPEYNMTITVLHNTAPGTSVPFTLSELENSTGLDFSPQGVNVANISGTT